MSNPHPSVAGTGNRTISFPHSLILPFSHSLILFTALSCASIQVESSHDSTVQFEDYKTFCWLGGCNFKYQGALDSLDVVRIKLAIENELIKKGFTNDEDDPDLLLDFHVWLTQQEYEKVHFENDYDFWPTYEQESFVKGSLIINMADSKNGVMIWQSTTSRSMDPKEEVDPKAIRLTIRRALQDFPPGHEPDPLR